MNIIYHIDQCYFIPTCVKFFILFSIHLEFLMNQCNWYITYELAWLCLQNEIKFFLNKEEIKIELRERDVYWFLNPVLTIIAKNYRQI